MIRAPSLLLTAVLAALVACDGDPAGPPPEPTPEPEPVRIVTTTLAPATVRQLYREGIDAEGGAGGYFWEIIGGALPPGVDLAVEDLSDDDVLLTGVPEAAGTFTFTLRVTIPGGVDSDTADFTLEVRPPPSALRLANIALPPTALGGEAAIPLRLTGGSGQFTWSVVAGALPPGLRLEPSGVIAGAPTAEGEFHFTVRATSGADSTFRELTLRVVPHDPTRFRLTPFPLVDISPQIRPHVDAALARWEEVITGDLQSGMIPRDFFAQSGCAGMGEEANGAAVDDVLVMINIDSIDGPGKVLGQAGPCAIRENRLPFIGVLTLDIADLAPLVGTSTLTAILAHEIGHVLGFGSLWGHVGLIQGAGTDDPRFTGPAAVAEWRALGGTGAVPVENQGGQGTADSHLRESIFDAEMMTGFSEPVGVPQPLSRVSIAAMADLGYVVDRGAADPFDLGTSALRLPSADAHGWDVAGVGPVRVLPGFGARSGGGTR